MKQTDIAELFSIIRSIVCCIIHLCESHGSVENRPWNHRAGVMGEITCRLLVHEVKKNLPAPISQITSILIGSKHRLVSWRSVQMFCLRLATRVNTNLNPSSTLTISKKEVLRMSALLTF